MQNKNIQTVAKTGTEVLSATQQAAHNLINNISCKDIKLASVKIFIAKNKAHRTYFQIPDTDTLTQEQINFLKDSGFKIKVYFHTATIINALPEHIMLAFFTSKLSAPVNCLEKMYNIKLPCPNYATISATHAPGNKQFSGFINKPMIIPKSCMHTYYSISSELTKSFQEKLSTQDVDIKAHVQKEITEGILNSFKYISTEEKFLTVRTTLNISALTDNDLTLNKYYEDKSLEINNLSGNNTAKNASEIITLNVFNSELKDSDVEQNFKELYGNKSLTLLQEASRRLLEDKPIVMLDSSNFNNENKVIGIVTKEWLSSTLGDYDCYVPETPTTSPLIDKVN